MESMDRYFCDLFYNVMNKYLLEFLNIEKVRDVKRALVEIRRNHKGDKAKEDLVHSFPIQNCALKGKENAYFFECSTCLASATAKTFQEVADNNKEIFKKIVQKKTINICCIAGGTASELVAVIKVLSNLSNKHTRFSLKFISASDIWDNITTAVLTELQRSYEKEEHKIKLFWDFVLVRKKGEHDYQEILEIFQSVDILLATKFSQDISEMPEKQLEQLLQVAFSHMKPNSLFFFMDTSTADFIKRLEKELSNDELFQNIHKQVSLYHTLTMKAIEDHLTRYIEHFGTDLNSSYCILSVFAWLRVNRKRNAKQKGIPVPIVKSHQMKKERQEDRGHFQVFRKRVENFFGRPQTLELENLVNISSSNPGAREANNSDNENSKCTEEPVDEKSVEPLSQEEKADTSPNIGKGEANISETENSKCTVLPVDVKSLEPLSQKGQPDRFPKIRTRKAKKRHNRKARLCSEIENKPRIAPVDVIPSEPLHQKKPPVISENIRSREANISDTENSKCTVVPVDAKSLEPLSQERQADISRNIGTQEANISYTKSSKCTVVPEDAKCFEPLSQEGQTDRSPNIGTREAIKRLNRTARLFSATENIPALYKRIESGKGTSYEPRYWKTPPVISRNIRTREANISDTENSKCTVVPVDAKSFEPLSQDGKADISSNIGTREAKISETENSKCTVLPVDVKSLEPLSQKGQPDRFPNIRTRKAKSSDTEHSKCTVVPVDAKSLEPLSQEGQAGPSQQHESLKNVFQATMESSVEKILTFQREMHEKYLNVQTEYLKRPSQQHESLKDVFQATVESSVEKILTFQKEMYEKYLDVHKEYLKIEKEKLKIRREKLELLKAKIN